MIDQEKLETLRTLAARALEKHENRQTIYVMVKREAPAPGSLNRVLGAPLGVTDETWPRFTIVPEEHGEYVESDNRMEHVFTIDLRDVTLSYPIPAGARAASFFLSNIQLNLAYNQPNQECRLYFWSEEDVARGLYEGELPKRKYGPGQARFFDVVAIEVPRVVFSTSTHEKGGELDALFKAIFACHARIGGDEIWVQGDPDENEFDGFDGFDGGDDGDDEDSGDEGGDDSDDDDSDDDDSDDDDSDDEADEPKKPLIQDLGLRGSGGFFMQFDEAFGNANLGDSGVMYVYGNGTAFWQCY